MNSTLKKALKAGQTIPQPTPEKYQTTDCRTIENWAEKVNFRSETVREKKSKKTDKCNRTHGDNYAPKRWKKDHPAFYFRGCVNVKKGR